MTTKFEKVTLSGRFTVITDDVILEFEDGVLEANAMTGDVTISLNNETPTAINSTTPSLKEKVHNFLDEVIRRDIRISCGTSPMIFVHSTDDCDGEGPIHIKFVLCDESGIPLEYKYTYTTESVLVAVVRLIETLGVEDITQQDVLNHLSITVSEETIALARAVYKNLHLNEE